MVRYAFHVKENFINIGIDLGTTNSAVAVHDNGVARVCAIDGHDVFPSAIYLGRRGGMMHGKRAYLRMAKSPQNVASGFKRELGTSWKFDFKGTQTTMTAEDCSAEIIKQLVAHAGAEYGRTDVVGAVITTPAAFTQPKLEATKRAADKAGLTRVALLQEPIAASMAVMEASNSKDTQFLVYDIGGGTLDLAIVSSVRGTLNIKGYEGVELFGGRDFDRKITDTVLCPWLMENFALPKDFQALERFMPLIRQLRFVAEEAKIALSANEEATIFASEDDLRIADDNDEDIFVEISISRADYEKSISEKVLESATLANKLLHEHGYSSQDMDKVVFVGGPTKTPCVREIVSRELGIPADMTVDPMTAVALGAAIYCESRDWQSSKGSSRKKTRTKQTIQGEVGIEMMFSSRVSDDRAQVKLRVLDGAEKKDLRFQIESERWASGWLDLEKESRIDIPVAKKGENRYRFLVVDSNHVPIENATREFVITRVAASVSAISATHAVAIRVAISEDRDADSTLHTIIKKGEHLPASGKVQYRSAIDVGVSIDEGTLNIELFEQPDASNKTIGEPNLFIGSCVIRSKDLNGGAIHKGDIVEIHWSKDESGLISAAVEIPTLQKTFDSHNFYMSQLAALQRTFGGEKGKAFMTSVVMDAKNEAAETKKIVDVSQRATVLSLENQINVQLDIINSHLDSETQQEADNNIREIRQKLFALRNDPQNKARYMQSQLGYAIRDFELVREKVDADVAKRFDDLAEKAEEAINNEDEDANKILDAIYDIIAEEYYPTLEFQVKYFNYMVQKRFSAIDREQFDRHVIEGQQAVMDQDADQLRSVNWQMRSNIVLPSDEQKRRFSADIMHS